MAAHRFWSRGSTAIFDIRVTDTDAASNQNSEPAKVLRRQEKAKKDKHGKVCKEAHMHFTPLVFWLMVWKEGKQQWLTSA